MQGPVGRNLESQWAQSAGVVSLIKNEAANPLRISYGSGSAVACASGVTSDAYYLHAVYCAAVR